MNEIWKVVPGWERYEVSNLGRVRNYLTKYVLKHRDQKGYKRVPIQTNDGRKRELFVHRLVAFAFIPNPNNKPDINHIDFNKENNTPSNLEWVTVDENNKHAIENGRMISKILTKENIEFICELRRDLNIDIDVLADMFNVTRSTIYTSCNGKLQRYKLVGEKTSTAKLKEPEVIKIRELSENGLSHTKIGRMFNVTSQNIDRIVSRKSWKHI